MTEVEVSQDSLRAVLDSVFAAPAYRWVERPDPFAVVRRWLGEVSRWLFELWETHPIGFRLFVAALVIVLVAILVHAAWVLVHTVRSVPEDRGPAADSGPRRDRTWYAGEADRLAGEGRFGEAMQADFLALVLALDAANVVRFHPAKTPREYASEPRLSRDARAELRDLVRALYGYAFGRWPCGPGEFAAWRQRIAPERYAASH